MEHEGKSYAGDIIIKQEKTFSVFAKPDITTRAVGRIRDCYANPRRREWVNKFNKFVLA